MAANLAGPALKPPANVTPNLTNPPNNNTLVAAVSIVCLVVVTLVVLIRCYTRYAMRIFLVEDCLMIIGYVIFIGSNIYGICIACVKAALLIEWIRIFVPGRKSRNLFFWCSAILITINTMYYTAATASQNLACTPYRYNWDKLIPGGGHCVDIKRLNLASACINLVSDVAIFILPQQVIWRLQMSTKRRLGVSLIFTTGLFGCATAIARVIVTLDYTRSSDVTYTVSPVTLWATGEMTSVFLVFCITAVPKAFKESGPASRLAASFRSWTRIPGGSGKRSQPEIPDSWDHNVGANTRAQSGIPLSLVSNESTKKLQGYPHQDPKYYAPSR